MPELDISFVINIVRSVQLTHYLICAIYALFVYDWLISLSDEYRWIHKSSWSSVKVLYLLCRYLPLFVWPAYMWYFLAHNPSPARCAKIIKLFNAGYIVLQIPPQTVMLVRAFAFTERKKPILAILLLAFSASVGANIWAYGTHINSASAAAYKLGLTGCLQNPGNGGFSSNLRSGVALMIAFGVDLLNTCVVVTHWYRMNAGKGSLATAFFQQGISAFVVLSAINLIFGALYFPPFGESNGISIGLVILLFNIVACRLILTLRAEAAPKAQASGMQESENFASEVSWNKSTDRWA